MKKLTKILMTVVLSVFILTSCNNSGSNMTTEQDLELQKKELDLKQKELESKEKQLAFESAQNANEKKTNVSTPEQTTSDQQNTHSSSSSQEGLKVLISPLMKQNFDRTNPDEADEYFMNCIREGNLKNAMSCFDQEAVYMDKDGNAIRGLDNIEKVMANLCKMKPDIKIYKHKNIPVGNDLIYRLDKWTLTATDPQGNPIKMQGASAHIMRKNADGVWLWLVDNPFAASFFAD